MAIYAPEYLFHPEGWLQHHVVEIDEQGFVLSVRKRSAQETVEELPGYLFPGLVNAHCHLELSHLAGQIEPGQGMSPFIREVFRLRNAFSEDQQLRAISQAIKRLPVSGTVAVGDICNTDVTVGPKKDMSDVYFHNFLELPGLDPSRAEQVWHHGERLQQSFGELPHSFTPHAPYSMSLPLLKRVYEHTRHASVHLLESRDEVELFVMREGFLADTFHDFGIVFPAFPDLHPIDYITRNLDPQTRIIWVHNTLISQTDISSLIRKAPDSYFCLCPLSNQFLHKRSPDLSQFHAVKHRVCLGTDSLASNRDIDLWKEVQEILTLADPPDFHTAVSWATTNGANALGIGNRFGKFRPGLRPGLLWARSPVSEKVEKIA